LDESWAYKSLKSFIDETDRKIEHSKLKLAEKQKDISEEIEDKESFFESAI